MRIVAVASLALTACSLYFDGGDDGNGSGSGSGTTVEAPLVGGSRSTCAQVGGQWWCWGANYADQITDMPGWDPRPKFSPETIAPRAVVLAMGGAHSCDVEADGSVNCWGSNWSGQLGRVTDSPNVNAEHNLPAPVQGLPAKGLAVAAGGSHSCAVLVDHSLWCWGDNTHGQLGVDVASGPTPRHVLDGVARVALGDSHSCAVTQDQSLWCWGANADGELGDGTTTDRDAPTAIGGLAPGAIALGRAHTCALATGGVTCWGANARGQLGDGTTTARVSPGMPITDGVDVVASGDHACVRHIDGSAACWGDNDDGELGDGTLAERHTPTTVAIGGSVAAISLGVAHACAMLADHSLACWGRDTTGELGDGSHVPIGPQSTALPMGASALAVGAFHACVIAGPDARVYCWGDDHDGQLGDGRPALASATVADTGLTGAAMIAAGVSHTCAVKNDHSLWCWGDNANGQLGDGTQSASAQPVLTPVTAVAVAAGDGFTCALSPSGGLQCFGRDDFGQLAAHATLPPLASISASYDHVCAVTTAGAAVCWGNNSHGQVGNGGVATVAAPAGPSGTYLQIAAGGRHTCAVPSPTTYVECWGGNDVDQLGGGYSLTDTYTPINAEAGLGTGPLVVGTGRAHTCVSGIDSSSGNMWTECFGENIDGQCAEDFRRVVSPMGLAGFVFATAIGGGDAFTCALVGTSVQCWGDNSRGQLGIGTFSRSTTPLALVIPGA